MDTKLLIGAGVGLLIVYYLSQNQSQLITKEQEIKAKDPIFEDALKKLAEGYRVKGPPVELLPLDEVKEIDPQRYNVVVAVQQASAALSRGGF